CRLSVKPCGVQGRARRGLPYRLPTPGATPSAQYHTHGIEAPHLHKPPLFPRPLRPPKTGATFAGVGDAVRRHDDCPESCGPPPSFAAPLRFARSSGTTPGLKALRAAHGSRPTALAIPQTARAIGAPAAVILRRSRRIPRVGSCAGSFAGAQDDTCL